MRGLLELVVKTLVPLQLVALLGAWLAWQYCGELLDVWATPLLEATLWGWSGSPASLAALAAGSSIRAQQTWLIALLVAGCAAAPLMFARAWRLLARQVGRRARVGGVVYVGLASGVLGASICFSVVLLPALQSNLYMGPYTVLPSPEYVVQSGLETFPPIMLTQNLLLQPPLLVLCLSVAGALPRTQYRPTMRWLVLVAFVGGAWVTPPDPVSQLLVAVVATAVYFVAVLQGYGLFLLRERWSSRAARAG